MHNELRMNKKVQGYLEENVEALYPGFCDSDN
jgi:hypothetical protein